MLGVPYAYGKEKHISITFISNTFTEKNSLRTKIGIEILIIALSVFVMIIGGCMVASNAAGQISSGAPASDARILRMRADLRRSDGNLLR